MVRLMTWNCQGLDDAAKFDAIKRYRAAKNINTIFIQEGSDAYDDPNSNNVRIESCDEKHGGNHSASSNIFALGNATKAEKVVRAAFGNRADYSGIGSDGTNKKYIFINPTTDPVLVPTTPDYAASNEVRTFIMQPAVDWVAKQPSPQNVVGSKRARSNSLDTKQVRAGYEIVVGGDLNRETVKRQTHGPTELRINLISRRRPRRVTMQIQGAAFDVYFWHAPLGNQAQLGPYGLLPAYTPCAGHASGGDLATIANILFAEYIGTTNAFPANTLLVGDLNIDSIAAQHIYKTASIVSSLDGWCHVIAPGNVAIQQQFAGDFAKAGGKYKCNVAGYDMDSDHAPVIVDV
jgi:hypothetical protein